MKKVILFTALISVLLVSLFMLGACSKSNPTRANDGDLDALFRNVDFGLEFVYGEGFWGTWSELEIWTIGNIPLPNDISLTINGEPACLIIEFCCEKCGYYAWSEDLSFTADERYQFVLNIGDRTATAIVRAPSWIRFTEEPEVLNPAVAKRFVWETASNPALKVFRYYSEWDDDDYGWDDNSVQRSIQPSSRSFTIPAHSLNPQTMYLDYQVFAVNHTRNNRVIFLGTTEDWGGLSIWDDWDLNTRNVSDDCRATRKRGLMR